MSHRWTIRITVLSGLLLAGVLGVGVAAGYAVGPPAETRPAGQTGEDDAGLVAVTMDAGADEAWTGGQVVYRIDVTNRTDRALHSAEISHIMPGQAFYESSDPAARSSADGQTRWSAHLPAGEQRTFSVTGSLTRSQIRAETPPDLRATACVAPDQYSDVVSCATVTDVAVRRTWWSPLRSPAAAMIGLIALAALLVIVTIVRSGRPRRRSVDA